MRFSARLVTVLATLIITSSAMAAELGIRVGRYDESRDDFVGVEAVISLGSMNLNPNIEYSLADDVTAGTVNLDVTFELGRFATAVPYIGAGLGLAYLDDDVGDSRTDVVGNLIGGVAFDLNFLNPYVQVKYFRLLDADDRRGGDEFAVAIGLRF